MFCGIIYRVGAANENKAPKSAPIRTEDRFYLRRGEWRGQPMRTRLPRAIQSGPFFGIISQDWAKNHMKLKRHFTSTRYFNIQRRFLHLRNYRNMLSKLVEIYRFELGRIESYANVLPLCSILGW